MSSTDRNPLFSGMGRLNSDIKEIEEMHVVKRERKWAMVKRELTAVIFFVGICFLISDLFELGIKPLDAVTAIAVITFINSLFIKKLDIHILKGYFDRGGK